MRKTLIGARGLGHGAWALALVVALAGGCRAATRVVDYPRADLEVDPGGNRGYLVGTPPPSAGPSKTTRQMVETEIEVPGVARRGEAPQVGLGELAPPETDMTDESLWSESGAEPEIVGSYTVQKGDTLWSIASQPTVYGDATKWRMLFDANRDTLKSPDRLKAGMTLRIPRADRSAGRSAESEPDGLTFKK